MREKTNCKKKTCSSMLKLKLVVKAAAAGGEVDGLVLISYSAEKLGFNLPPSYNENTFCGL